VLHACRPFSYLAAAGKDTPRAKIGFETLSAVREAVDRLAASAGIDYEVPDLAAYPKNGTPRSSTLT